MKYLIVLLTLGLAGCDSEPSRCARDQIPPGTIVEHKYVPNVEGLVIRSADIISIDGLCVVYIRTRTDSIRTYDSSELKVKSNG